MGINDPIAPRRSGVIGIHSLDHFAISVPSLDEAEHFFGTFGLDVRRVNGAVELRAFGDSHCWGVLHASDKPKKIEYLSYGIFADNHAAFEARIAQSGVGCSPHPPGIPVCATYTYEAVDNLEVAATKITATSDAA